MLADYQTSLWCHCEQPHIAHGRIWRRQLHADSVGRDVLARARQLVLGLCDDLCQPVQRVQGPDLQVPVVWVPADRSTCGLIGGAGLQRKGAARAQRLLCGQSDACTPRTPLSTGRLAASRTEQPQGRAHAPARAASMLDLPVLWSPHMSSPGILAFSSRGRRCRTSLSAFYTLPRLLRSTLRCRTLSSRHMQLPSWSELGGTCEALHAGPRGPSRAGQPANARAGAGPRAAHAGGREPSLSCNSVWPGHSGRETPRACCAGRRAAAGSALRSLREPCLRSAGSGPPLAALQRAAPTHHELLRQLRAQQPGGGAEGAGRRPAPPAARAQGRHARAAHVRRPERRQDVRAPGALKCVRRPSPTKLLRSNRQRPDTCVRAQEPACPPTIRWPRAARSSWSCSPVLLTRLSMPGSRTSPRTASWSSTGGTRSTCWQTGSGTLRSSWQALAWRSQTTRSGWSCRPTMPPCAPGWRMAQQLHGQARGPGDRLPPTQALTLIDLPGITQVKAGSQSREVPAKTREIVEK